MKIHKENIDELLFEYFEGNLTDSEKGELMNFIHHNPEFNDDFTSWAQSYAHVHEPMEDYRIAGKLKRKDDFQFRLPGSPLRWYGLMVIVAALLLWFLNNRFMNDETLKTENARLKEVKTLPEKSTGKKSPAVKADTISAQRITEEIVQREDAVSKSAAVSMVSPYTEPAPVISDTLLMQTDQSAKLIPLPDSLTVNEKKDSLVVNKISPATLQPPLFSKEKKGKTKSKKKINLKPTPEFLPVNKDL